MYDLGDQYKIDYALAKANPECVFQGNKYRITVLSEGLLRLEYNESGIFEDRPTELVFFRNLEKPKFTVEDTNQVLRIKTKYFELIYIKERKFLGTKINPTLNLRINLVNSDKIWYYGHPEIRNHNTNSTYFNDRKLPKGLYSTDGFTTIDDSKSLIVKENGMFTQRENSSIDLYVFLYNKNFYQCLNDYFQITGNPPLIPRYALGNWWCKDEEYNENDILKIVNKFKINNVPISIFMLNNWQNNDSYLFNERFKNPKAVIEYLKQNNITLGLNINDVKEFKKDSDMFNRISNYIVPDSKGNLPFNVYDERAIDTYLKIIINPLYNIGIDLFFLNNYQNIEKDRNFILKHFLCLSKKINNKRYLMNSMNSLVAPHRYSTLYTGKINVDWSSLKKIPKTNILAYNYGLSFINYDIGGTSDGIEDSELFIRFVQLGVFSPILRLGSDGGKYYKREPWKWDVTTNTIVSNFLNLRYKLIPYIYTESYKYYKYGKPLIMPLYNIYVDLYDDDLYSNEYFFGDSILVCPITNKKDLIMNRVIHKIFLPKGTWYDVLSGKKYTGDRRYVTFYKENEYPIFVKAGTIMPLSLNEYNDTGVPKKMQIDVYPGASNTYSIYEDDGITKNYINDDYLITNVEYVYSRDSYKLTILPVAGKNGVIPSKRDYRICFRNTKLASAVASYVGNTVVQNKSYTENDNLIVEVSDIPTNGQLTIICSGSNIEMDALRIINEDIVSIISDLPIKTIVKQKIDSIMFSDVLTIKKKRIEIRKLANGKNWIERKYIDLFLKLLEYIEKV